MAGFTPAPDVVVSGRYRLERLLGEGGMGAVWSATHVITRKHVALKFLKTSERGNENLIRRFLREARAVSAVNHPNVVAVHDIVQLDDGTPVMVMDLLNGCSLADHLVRVKAMPVDELAQVLVPVLSAVGTAHANGIVHRDLKPDNIYLHVRADGRMEPKVLDFGIAKLSATEGEAAQTAHLTQTGAMLGTPYYMSPEQVFGEKDIDQRADVWSMGIMMYECLAGCRPIEGENFGQLFKAIATGTVVPLEQIAPTLPVDVTRLVARMLRPDRNERPADLREAYETLSRYTSDKAISFGGAVASASVETDGGHERHASANSDASLAFDATSAVQEPNAAALSADKAFSRSSAALAGDGAPARRSLRKPAAIALALVGTVGIASGWFWLQRSHLPVPPDASAAAPGAAPPPVAAPVANTTTAAAPSHSAALAVAPLVAPVASDSATAPPAAHPVATPGRPRPSPKPKPEPAKPVSPAAPPAAPTPSAKPVKLPGSVVSDVPF